MYQPNPNITVPLLDSETVTAFSYWIAQEFDYELYNPTRTRCCQEPHFDWYRDYTQLMWEHTKSVGCATVKTSQVPNGERLMIDVGLVLPKMGLECRITVCHYDPPGNIIGEFPFSNSSKGL